VSKLEILRLDATSQDISPQLNKLRALLSPSGDIVSPRGRELTKRVFGEPLSPAQVVQRICNDVQTRRDEAVLHYSKELDQYSPSGASYRVAESELAAAHRACDSEFLQVVRRIRDRIFDFQSKILHRDVTTRPSAGVTLQQRYTPLRRVGLCIPGGAAAYPSSLLMTAVPAMAAGVAEIVVVGPPTKLGAFNPDIQAICFELGIKELYAVGGAQAVAAMAYGTPTIERVDKIVGPGNLFVALAKKHVYGEVDIDSIAGPSEVVVLADEQTPLEFAASDMLSQAEHSPGSSVLISWSQQTLDNVYEVLQQQVNQLERGELIINSLNEYGAMIRVRDADQACEIIQLLAPEHLHLAVENARDLLPKVTNAGATFVGNFAPVAVGDYAAGPSHVLPTGGTARWASGLSSNHFLRSSSVIEFDEKSLAAIAPDVCALADKEGLTAHKHSITVRVQD
jgi:histidinol dehydrogenase